MERWREATSNASDEELRQQLQIANDGLFADEPAGDYRWSLYIAAAQAEIRWRGLE
jgi:hypothetical protein